MDLRRNTLPRLLAGLQVGILGGLSIFLWFLLLSYWGFRSPWGLLNLIAASLRNHATWGLSFTASTWTGLAAHLFTCGCLGMAVGWILPRPLAQVKISLSGFVFGIVLSLMAYELFWHRFVPLLGEYVRPAASLVSHFLFGVSLAQFPKFYHQLVDVSETTPTVVMMPSELTEGEVSAEDPDGAPPAQDALPSSSEPTPAVTAALLDPVAESSVALEAAPDTTIADNAIADHPATGDPAPPASDPAQDGEPSQHNEAARDTEPSPECDPEKGDQEKGDQSTGHGDPPQPLARP